MTPFARTSFLALAIAGTALIPVMTAAEDRPDNFAYIYGDHDRQWRSCHSDDDCALIVTDPICTYKLPVSRDYFDKASDYASKHNACSQAPLPDRTGTTYSTTCQAHECILKKRLEN